MKNRIVILIASAILGVTLYSCQEEPVGQTPADSTPPGKITNPVPTPLPGGARISYTLPKDDDLWYVKAVYSINGEEKTDAASLYANSVEVMGFGSTDEQTVHLYSVDRSGNHSEAVDVKIKPDTPPIQLIRESMDMSRAFGGVKLLWKNECKAPVAIYLLAADSIGDIQVADVVYTEAIDGKFNLRGFDDSERIFGALVRDKWNNYSDTLKGKYKPFFEEELKKPFAKQVLYGDNPQENGDRYAFSLMWDGLITPRSWDQINQAEGVPNYFTIDLQVTAKLSRYTIWQRHEWQNNVWNYMYDNANPRKWQIYGTDHLSTSANNDYWMEGWKDDWVLLKDCEIVKPSGSGPLTQSDIDAVFAGHEFEIPIDMPPVRYVRFQLESNWGGNTLDWWVAELSFWGEIKK